MQTLCVAIRRQEARQIDSIRKVPSMKSNSKPGWGRRVLSYFALEKPLSIGGCVNLDLRENTFPRNRH